MTRLAAIFVAAVCAGAAYGQGAPVQGGAEAPYTMEYYYQTQWGHQQEFLRLFLKNHYPLLRKQVESGRILSVRIEQPANHMTETGRWDYRVTIVFKDAAAAFGDFDEQALIRQMYPDQATYKKEEQRRFEILDQHTDVPIVPVDMASQP
jgi:hypothetical protein